MGTFQEMYNDSYFLPMLLAKKVKRYHEVERWVQTNFKPILNLKNLSQHDKKVE